MALKMFQSLLVLLLAALEGRDDNIGKEKILS